MYKVSIEKIGWWFMVLAVQKEKSQWAVFLLKYFVFDKHLKQFYKVFFKKYGK